MKRKNELVLSKRVGITQEVHDILSDQRVKQKKSRARIVNDLVLEKFDREIIKINEKTINI